MKLVPQPVRNLLKQSDSFMSLYTKLNWQIYLFKDFWGTKVWKKTTVVTTPLGFKLASGLHEAYQQMRDGTFEIDETKLIKHLIKDADVFIDIGANLGYFTCLALQNHKHVLAFEPQPQNLKCLYENITANGWKDKAEVFPLALSNSPGLLDLYGASGPSASLVKNWAGYSSRFKQTVPISTLDNILGTRFESKKLLIKMDVEGAEYQVLSGATNTINSKIKPSWLIEISSHEFHPEGFNPDLKKIFELFWNKNYLAFTATAQPRPVRPEDVTRWIEKRHCDSGTFNYIFVESEKQIASSI